MCDTCTQQYIRARLSGYTIEEALASLPTADRLTAANIPLDVQPAYYIDQIFRIHEVYGVVLPTEDFVAVGSRALRLLAPYTGKLLGAEALYENVAEQVRRIESGEVFGAPLPATFSDVSDDTLHGTH